MSPAARVLGIVAIALAAGGFTGCGDAADDDAPQAQDGVEYEGLSPEQIEAEATPMRPEVAESLGIVDTTILLQPPMNPDSVVPLDTAPVVQ